MKKTIFNKLVRDRIPEIIQQAGKMPVYEPLDETSYCMALNDKLAEEIAEYQTDNSIEELADVCEVIRAILRAQGASWEDLESIRIDKAQKRGGFEKRFFLKEVVEE